MSLRLWLAFLIILVATVSCKPNSQDGIENPENILFIGNSYTFINDMPEIFTGLAELGGHEVSVTTLAKAGYSLMEHAEDPQTREVIQSNNWDYIILQEKSSLPFLDLDATADGISHVMEMAAAQGANLILFLPWAYQSGFPEAGLEDYQAMQSKATEVYLDLGRDFRIQVAPVGFAWQSALEQDPALELWSIDGSHPSLLGSYLAAATFYALIFQEHLPSNQIPESDSADVEIINMLGEIVAETVLGTPGKWNP